MDLHPGASSLGVDPERELRPSDGLKVEPRHVDVLTALAKSVVEAEHEVFAHTLALEELDEFAVELQ